jgi:hypothetical protein
MSDEIDALKDQVVVDTALLKARAIEVKRLRSAIREALWWAEQHTDSAVTRRLRDYRKTVDALVTAVQEGALTALRNHCSDPND